MELTAYILIAALLALGAILTRARFADFLAQRAEDYADSPGEAFDLRTHLNGPMICEGVIYGPLGRVKARFWGEFSSSWTGNKGVMNEIFYYDDGSTVKRAWHMTLGNDGKIKATADDVVGTGEGMQCGNAVHIKYRYRLPEDAGSHVLDVVDWLYLAPNGTIVNRSQFRKFGIKMAELIATIRPVDAHSKEAA